MQTFRISDDFFQEGKTEVIAGMKEEGEMFVEDAKATGSYRDCTGHLKNRMIMRLMKMA